MKAKKLFYILIITVMHSCSATGGNVPQYGFDIRTSDEKCIRFHPDDFVAFKLATGYIVAFSPETFLGVNTDSLELCILQANVLETDASSAQVEFQIQVSSGGKTCQVQKGKQVYLEVPIKTSFQNSLQIWEDGQWSHYQRRTSKMIPLSMSDLHFQTICMGQENYEGTRDKLREVLTHQNFVATREFSERYNVLACNFDNIKAYLSRTHLPLATTDSLMWANYNQRMEKFRKIDRFTFELDTATYNFFHFQKDLQLQGPWDLSPGDISETPEKIWEEIWQKKGKASEKEKEMILWMARNTIVSFSGQFRNVIGSSVFFPVFIQQTGKFQIEAGPDIWIPGYEY